MHTQDLDFETREELDDFAAKLRANSAQVALVSAPPDKSDAEDGLTPVEVIVLYAKVVGAVGGTHYVIKTLHCPLSKPYTLKFARG